MSLLKPIEPAEATGETKSIFDTLEQNIGRVPMMMRLMAHSPAILDTYVHFNRALERTTLSPRTRALITVAIAEMNADEYTLSLGMALGKRQGVTEAELDAARLGQGHDGKTAATLQLATGIVRSGGRVPHAEVARLLAHEFSSAEIVDIIAVVAINIFRNYFNLALDTDIDSPVVRTGQSAHAV
jgi:alkylhydroperoxidase family enzyme